MSNVSFALSFSSACPGLFYPTSAQDGVLSRIRIPGGIITSNQLRVVADFAEKYGAGYAHITNRANLQIREVSNLIADDVLAILQEIGIASAVPSVDHLRNIMGSPTAGIDTEELIDTRPLIKELDNYISIHPELIALSPKFSVAFDGGGRVSIATKHNDVALNAVIFRDQVYFQLKLVGVDTGVLLKPEESVDAVIAIANVYLDAITSNKVVQQKRPPRLKQVLQEIGVEKFLFCTANRFPDYLPTQNDNSQLYNHIGIHPQHQAGLFYMGVVVPLGRLESLQMYELAAIAQIYASGTLRLTPWQNLLLPDIPNQYIDKVKQKIKALNLDWSKNNIRSALVACTGNAGCKSSATNTKSHALALAEYLDKNLTIDRPVNIHFTGCDKSCAQNSHSDIALLGVTIEESESKVEGYNVYIGEGNSLGKFGREIYHNLPFREISPLIARILQVYMAKRDSADESFSLFTQRYSTKDLQTLFLENKTGKINNGN